MALWNVIILWKRHVFFFKSNYYTSVINGRGGSKGEAGGGEGEGPSLSFGPNWGPTFFWDRPPPLIQGSGWRPPSPLPPLSEVLDPPLNGVGKGHRCCSRLNLKISLKTKFVWVGLAEANWFNYTDLVASTGKNCDLACVKGLNPGLISKGWVWSSRWT